MLVKIQNLILEFLSALTIIAAAFLLSACVPSEAEPGLSSNSDKKLNIKKLVPDWTDKKRSSTNQATLAEKVGYIDPDSPFANAARKNVETERNLKWLFGKKPQVGWYLYKPLICKEVGIKLNSSPTEFAESLSRWQKTAGLQPNGVFDELTMFAFMSRWQDRRLFKRGVPPDQQLVIAPSDDFYDPSRSVELRQIERETYEAYKRMVKAAVADPSLKLKTDSGKLASTEKFLKIISSFRTREYQQKLRAASPNSGSAGLAVNSPHFTGRALDIYVGGKPVSTADSNRAIQINTPVYLWMVENAEKFGFRPYFYEPWHWEYVPD